MALRHMVKARSQIYLVRHVSRLVLPRLEGKLLGIRVKYLLQNQVFYLP